MWRSAVWRWIYMIFVFRPAHFSFFLSVEGGRCLMHFNLTVLRRIGICIVKLVSSHNLFRSLKCEINKSLVWMHYRKRIRYNELLSYQMSFLNNKNRVSYWKSCTMRLGDLHYAGEIKPYEEILFLRNVRLCKYVMEAVQLLWEVWLNFSACFTGALIGLSLSHFFKRP